MENERKSIYAVVLVCSLAVSGVLLYHSFLATPAASHQPTTPVQAVVTEDVAVVEAETSVEEPVDDGEEEAMEGYEITAEDLQMLLESSTNWLTTEKIEVEVGEDGLIFLEVEMPKEQAVAWLSLPTITQSLLPDMCTLQVTCSVGLYTEAQKIIVEPTALAVNGIDLTAILGQPITNHLASLLQTCLTQSGVTAGQIAAQDGMLIFQLDS